MLIDFKSSISYDRLALQLAGYAHAHPDCPNVLYGAGVQIKENGSYVMTKPIKLRPFVREFLAMRAVYNIRRRIGIN